ncbi:MAG TPA: hypothetical protein VIM70_03655 [Clostridium sp.]|uniref:hypothetical protein n=1 Tax=Clostridium sp. TaxID=1506 RepID=UPI002F95416E
MSFLTIQKKHENSKIKRNKTKEQASKTVQELLDIQGLEDNIINNTGYSKYYIKIAPKNINIMTNEFLLNEILNLKAVCNVVDSIEFLVVDKVERLEDNKNYIISLIDNSTDNVTKMLLERDLQHLKQLESEKGSSREFYIVIPFKTEEPQSRQVVLNLQQTLEDRGFTTLGCDKKTLKNMLQVYLERNFSGDIVKDFDI